MKKKSPKIALAILASGQSSRMDGRDKLLLERHGISLLKRICQEAKRSAVNDAAAILPERAYQSRLGQVAGLPVVKNPHFKEGIAASIRLAASHFKSADALVLVLADMPMINACHINVFVDGFNPLKPSIIRLANTSGKVGHPVLFPRAYFDKLEKLRGDLGARDLVKKYGAKHILAKKNDTPIFDIDTPEDWAKWLSYN